jgi:hypothetical protein
VAAETARVAALNVTVDGPVYMNRRRPDGKLVEWDLAFLGDQGAGATLPFVIKDITPREWRVQPSASVAGRLTGVAMVVLGVENLESAAELFRRVYGWPAPQVRADPVLKAKLAYFDGSPVTLAAPLTGENWLTERLARFGQSPCAFLLKTGNFEMACKDFKLIPSAGWFERRLAWFDPAQLDGVKLGVIA